MPWSESLCGQYAFNSGLRVLAMLPCCIVWGVDGGVRCKLHSVGRVERVGHALLLCWCVVAILAVRLVIPHGVAAIGVSAMRVSAMRVPRLRDRLRCCTCVASLTIACVVLMCPSWEQAVRLLTGLRFSWISAPVVRPCTHSTTTAAPAVVVTGKRALPSAS